MKETSVLSRRSVTSVSPTVDQEVFGCRCILFYFILFYFILFIFLTIMNAEGESQLSGGSLVGRSLRKHWGEFPVGKLLSVV